MKVEDQFQLVLETAIKRGWNICGFLTSVNCDKWQQGIHQWQNVVDLCVMFHGKPKVIQADTIWFDHDFAYHFFGYKPMMMGEIKEQGKYSANVPYQEGDIYLGWGGTFADFNLIKLAITPRDKRLDYLLRFV